MMTPVTGRQRASRIPLDYFKTVSRWERRKRIATVVAAVAAAAWWTGGTLLSRQNAALHSPGSLASVHHTWESQCSACHADFHPIRDDALGTRWEGGTATSDRKCQACHRGGEHHPLKQGSAAPGCSSCHQEHQGTQASLLRMDDAACTRCHQEIDQHLGGKPSSMSSVANVARFDKEHHPEFASAQKDFGHLKFSHYRHVTPGLVNNSGGDKAILTLAGIPDPVQRERYRRPGQSDDSPVQLDCGSCHQVDGGDFKMTGVAGMSQSLLAARSAGGYMLPITYENQCQACHPLYKTPGVVHHRQSPQELHQDLQRAFAEEYLEGNRELLERFVPPEPLPNSRLAVDETVDKTIRGKIETAEKVLSQEYCGKCHEPVSLGPGLQPVVPPHVPQVWFQRAKFDHRAHRAIDCRECHAAAYADAPNPSRESKDVLIPQRDVCLKCHSPPSQSGSVPIGGARFDCVECHRYHNGSAPFAGSGAEAENPVHKLSAEEFVAGKTGEWREGSP
jgi:predicted CXXCH cytochrome family protein